MVICLERGADLHMAQLMPLPLTVCCSSKIQFGFAFLVPAHPGSPGKKPLHVCIWSTGAKAGHQTCNQQVVGSTLSQEAKNAAG